MSGPVDHCMCAICDKSIPKKGGAIECTQCGKWCHSKCADVSNDQLKLLKLNAKLGFFCGTCQDEDEVDDVLPSSLTDKNEIQVLRNEVKSGFDTMNKNFKDMMEQMNATLSMKISELKSDIDSCNTNNKATASKVSALEIENNVLHKRMNRCDIIATGMSHSNNIMDTVLSLAEFLNVPITAHDIQQCCFVDKKDKILIKFNSADKKDLLMESYFKVGKLKLSDFVKDDNNIEGNKSIDDNHNEDDFQRGGENQNGKENQKQKRTIKNIHARVYLNDNLTPMERKLSYFCRNLKRSEKIQKFKLMHSNIPKVKIVLPSGNNKYLLFWECYAEFGNQLQQH